MNPARIIRPMTCCPKLSRLKLILTRFGSLLLLFQRMPVVQFLLPEANILGGAAAANSLALAVTTVVGLGAYDAVAGATTIDEALPLVVTGATSSRTTTANAVNVPATVSAALNFEFKCINAASDPKSWRIVTSGGTATTLPTGLTMTNTSSVPAGVLNNYITGTPAQAGTHQVYVRVYENSNYGGGNVTQLFNICALGFSTQPAATTTINSGGTTTLTCVATGVPVATTRHNVTPTVTYQWYQGTSGTMTTPVGTTNSSTPGFTTPALTATTNYWVRIKSVLGTSTVYANSNTAVVNVTADTTAPTVTINQAAAPQVDPTNVSPVNFTVVFSEAVANFATGDVTIGGTAGGTKTATVTGSGTTYNVAVSGMTGSGTVTASLAAGVASDAAGNPSAASTSTDNTVTYDNTAPTVTINQATGQADPTNASPVNFTVVFSETVANFATGDVTIGGTAGGTKTATVTGSGTTYNVAVSGMTGNGTVIASLAGGVASDAVGNPSAASTTTDNTVTYSVDPYADWAGGLPADQRGANQIPQNDGVTNLMKYACNLNPLAPDVSRLTVGGNETKGLPVHSIVGGRIRMEFLRRKAGTNPGITYTMQFSPDLNPANWTSMDVSTSPSGTSLNADWERVTVDAPVGDALRFARLKVTQP